MARNPRFPMCEPTTTGKRIQTTGLVLLVVGACCPAGWHGVGAGLLGLLLLAGRSLWVQAKTRGSVAMPWVLAALLAWWGLSISVVPPGRLGALREWLQWGLLLGGGWYASRALGRDGWERFPTIASVGLGVSLAVGVLQLVWPGATAGLVSFLHGASYAAGGNGPDLVEEVVVGLQRSHLQYCALVYLALPFALSRLRHVWLRLPLLFVACYTVQPPGLLLLPVIGIGMCLVVPWGQKEHRTRDLLLRLSVLLIANLSIGLRLGAPATGWFLPDRPQERLAIERQAALSSVPARPVGYGPGTYRESVRKARIAADLPKPEQDRVRRDGNSQFLVHMIETGAIGAVLLLTYILLAIWRARGRNEVAVALLVVLIVGLVTVFLVRGLGPLCCVLLGYGWARSDARGGRHLLAQIALIAVAVGAGLAWPYREEVAAVPAADLPDTQERIWVEAETAKTISPRWRVDPEADAGGNEVLRVPLGVGKRVGEASYQLVSPAAGRWKLWLRVRWSGGCANSILASVDGSPPASVEDAIFGRWHWVDVHPKHTFVLPEGEFELVLGNSEDDVAVDQIVFLPDPKDMPVGILEAADSAEAEPEPAAAPAQGWDFDEEAAPSDRSFNKYDD